MIDVHPEVRAALDRGAPVVALESTIIAHGMPHPHNIAVARSLERIVRDGGATPATIAVIAGRIKIGLADDALEWLGTARDVRKLSRGDLGHALVSTTHGATTVAATMRCAHLAGIAVFATGGIGGVHRGAEATMDVSADLDELARTPVAVVCAGAKALLDLPKTLEALETRGVPVVGYGTAEFPAFWSRSSGLKLGLRLDSPVELANLIHTERSLGGQTGILIGNPIPAAAIPAAEIDAHIETALAAAREQHVTGAAVTPFLLDRIYTSTAGRSLTANVALVESNVRLAVAVAAALAEVEAAAQNTPGMPQGSRMTALDTGVALFATPETRVEGREKVSGRLAYTADITRPGTLWAAFATSPFAHARIVRIDVDAAKAVPGVRAVLTGADIGPRRFGRQLYDWPVLAYDTARFLGERVAAVAAETREAAEVAARAIEVTYEELPAVFDAQAALAADAPVLHPEWSSYHFAYLGDRPSPARPHPNIQGAIVLAHGEPDLEPIFARAHRVFEHVFRMPRQHAGYIEPRSTIVWLDDDGRVHVQSPNKTPFSLRRQLARVAGIAEEQIVVETSAIGGDFGGKGLTIDEFPCYFLAKATGRPVRYVQTYGEELRNGPTRHRTVATLRTAVAADGTFLAHASTVLYDGGAYAAGKPIPTLVPGNGYGAIPYRVPNVRLDIRTVYTNALPAGHVRGPSGIQTFYAWEQHVEMIAEALGRDPLAFRRQNVVRDGDTTLSGEPVSGPCADAVLAALERELAHEALPAGRARGVAFTCGHTGGGKTSIRVTLNADGTLAVVLGVPDQGVGIFTVIGRVIAAALEIAPERITVRRGSTSEALTDPGSGHSRVTHVVGRAAQDAAAQLRALLVDERGVPPTEATFAARARAVCRDGPREVVGTFADPHGDGGSDLSFAAYAIDVHVDRETGALALHDVLFVTDVGQIINPIAHQGQIDGGFIFGLGNALMEEIALDETGRIGTPSLGEYKLPGMRDVPPFRTILVPAPPGDGPFGAKMAGELSNNGVAPAIANAIYHAVGVRLNEYPLTAERVHAALQNAH